VNCFLNDLVLHNLEDQTPYSKISQDIENLQNFYSETLATTVGLIVDLIDSKEIS
jgi:hypothetical protein